jgi:hypothetical protein
MPPHIRPDARPPIVVRGKGRQPAFRDHVPVLAEVEAPRFARPLRAAALTSGCAPELRHLSPAGRVSPLASSPQRNARAGLCLRMLR